MQSPISDEGARRAVNNYKNLKKGLKNKNDGDEPPDPPSPNRPPSVNVIPKTRKKKNEGNKAA